MNLYWLHIPEGYCCSLDGCSRQLPKRTQLRVHEYRFAEDRRRVVLGSLFIRYILGRELNRDPSSLRIIRELNGKPYLAGGERHFNLSYGGDAMMLVTDALDIGLDLERMDFDLVIEDVRGVLSPIEQTMIDQEHGDSRIEKFYEVWVAKESYVKAIGLGLHLDPSTLSVDLADGEPCILVDGARVSDWHLKSYPVEGRYRCAVCARHTQFAKTYQCISQSEIISTYVD